MKAEWSTACDVYSFGLLLFEMLHGELAFSHLSSVQSAMVKAGGLKSGSERLGRGCL